jgi:hypothetical protein
MSFLLDVIQTADLLSPNTQILFNGSSRYKNVYGGVSSVLLVVLSLIAFTYFCNIALSRLEASTLQSEIFINNPSYTLNTSETLLLFRLSDIGARALPLNTYTPIAKNIFYDFVTNSTGQKVQVITSKTLDVFPCPDDYKLDSDSYRTLFANITLTGYYCFAPNQTIDISGVYAGIDNFHYLTFYFSQCGGTNTNCASQAVIDSNLLTYGMDIIYVDNYIDHTNYLTPVIPYTKRFQSATTSAVFKKAGYFIKPINYISDDGFLLEDKVTYNSYTYESDGSTTDTRISYIDPSVGKLLCQWTLGFSSKGMGTYVVRSYKKLQNVLAEIGGFINLLKVILQVLLFMYYNQAYYLSVFNHFKIKTTEPYELSGVKVNNFDNSTIELENKPAKIANIKLPSLPKVVFESLLCRQKRSKEVALFTELKRTMKTKYLDIASLMKLRNEVDIIKMCLFKNDNLKDFNLASGVLFAKDFSLVINESEYSAESNMFEKRFDALKTKILRDSS